MGKRKGKKLQAFFGQWAYSHEGMNKRILHLKKSMDETKELLKQRPEKK